MVTQTAAKPRKTESDQEIVLTGFTTEALIADLRARRKDLTAEQHNELVGLGLDLCASCMKRIRAWMPAHGWGLVQFTRRKLWSWLRGWEHGQGCPKEDTP